MKLFVLFFLFIAACASQTTPDEPKCDTILIIEEIDPDASVPVRDSGRAPIPLPTE